MLWSASTRVTSCAHTWLALLSFAFVPMDFVYMKRSLFVVQPPMACTFTCAHWHARVSIYGYTMSGMPAPGATALVCGLWTRGRRFPRRMPLE